MALIHAYIGVIGMVMCLSAMSILSTIQSGARRGSFRLKYGCARLMRACCTRLVRYFKWVGIAAWKALRWAFDREIETGIIGEGGASMLRTLPQELVKRGTDLMRYFTNENPPFLWGGGQSGVHDENEFATASCPTTATLDGIFTRIGLSEPVSSSLKGFQVLDCPLNLEARAIKGMHVRQYTLPEGQSGQGSNE